MTKCEYVLVTPARNEEQFIATTIRSVVSQTILPKRWVIISDGSTDRTDDIISTFAEQYVFIRLLRTADRGKRSFGAKANAFRASYEELGNMQFDYVGNLDADVSFAPDYYEKVLGRFETQSSLGIGGGLIHELINGGFVQQRTSSDSVAGAVQMFRRRCYEEIGGYLALRFGGIDSAAEIMARMHGWEVRMFADLEVRHYRPVGTGAGGMIKTKFRHGRLHYSLGYHPVFELLRCLDKLTDRPFVVGGMLMISGYFWSLLTRKEKELPPEVVRYLRSEQMERLRAVLVKRAVKAPVDAGGH